ncbi:ATP-binding protein [Anaeromyxobacter oryzisoli]|jgi:anti-sigma regulatory factor (Ser/Thr protein kinase)|uniref:ATP-binding protein n=1 Tax=Anaeromyxobacter oryzisoli TaxID=2925408 RepID=UPI001F56B70C|nr:ATP-binding protein [Anaeromyxobacter sp. SG63]
MTEAKEQKQPIYLTMRMKPPWVFIDELRRFVESFCACACPECDREAQLALTVHELMQNAVPHSHDEEVELTLEVEPAVDRVAVSISNACTDDEFNALAARVQRMNREPDALQHYLRAMEEAPAHTRGGLGLARIRYEAQLDLSVSRSWGRLTVHAFGKLHVQPLRLPGGIR